LDNIEERIIAIKQKIADTERRKARAEIQREQAKETFKSAIDKLESIFHVTSIEEAKELLEGVQSKLDEVLLSVESTLDRLEEN
jgi:hypothetical protein